MDPVTIPWSYMRVKSSPPLSHSTHHEKSSSQRHERNGGNCKYLENKDHSNYVTKACKRACCEDVFYIFVFVHRKLKAEKEADGQKRRRDFSNQIYVRTISCHLFIVINLIRNVVRARMCVCELVQNHKFMSLCNTSFEYFYICLAGGLLQLKALKRNIIDRIIFDTIQIRLEQLGSVKLFI